MQADVIECFPQCAWTAEACAASALERISKEPAGTPFAAVWLGADGTMHWSMTNLPFAAISQMAITLTELAQRRVREDIVEDR